MSSKNQYKLGNSVMRLSELTVAVINWPGSLVSDRSNNTRKVPGLTLRWDTFFYLSFENLNSYDIVINQYN